MKLTDDDKNLLVLVLILTIFGFIALSLMKPHKTICDTQPHSAACAQQEQADQDEVEHYQEQTFNR